MKNYSCPSGPLKKGATLLGQFKDSNVLQYEKELKTIDDTMAEKFNKENASSYRAAITCASKGCYNWNGKECTVPDQMRPLLNIEPTAEVENCVIRNTCRWFSQEGYSACEICPLIKTAFFIKE